MIYFVGLGVGNPKHITAYGCEILRTCKCIYIDGACSIDNATLEQLCDNEIISMNYTSMKAMAPVLSDAFSQDIALVFMGDPVCCSSYSALNMRAIELGIKSTTVHNSSLLTAVGACGLQLYNFGSVVMGIAWSDPHDPDRVLTEIVANRSLNLHTLCLLDSNDSDMAHEKTQHFNDIGCKSCHRMTVKEAAGKLLNLVKRNSVSDILTSETFCVGLTALGTDNQMIFTGSLHDLANAHFEHANDVHLLVIPGVMHSLEEEMLHTVSRHPFDAYKKNAGLYLIGLGLGDARDITLKGLDVIRRAKRVYLEAYTSVLTVDKDTLEKYYGRKVILADREMVEQSSDLLLLDADVEEVAFLIVGDPVGATTHTDLALRAAEKGIPYHIIHNASVMHAVGCCGLQVCRFGQTVSVVFWTDTWKPESFYDKIVQNRQRGLHTLCLLDIKMKERTIENLMRGREIFRPPRFMSVNQAASQLLDVSLKRATDGFDLCNHDLLKETISIGLSRIGAEDQNIVATTLHQLVALDIGRPLHSLIIPGSMGNLEMRYMQHFASGDDIRQTLSDML